MARGTEEPGRRAKEEKSGTGVDENERVIKIRGPTAKIDRCLLR